MNRRQRKSRRSERSANQVKKKARVAGARRRPAEELLLAAGARAPFGPCYVSADWEDPEQAALVTLVVTRRLPDERLVVGIALIDRTCLGIKDGYFQGPWTEDELEEYLEQIGMPHGGMKACELLVAQSITYRAVDYARRLGFAPHRDFPEPLFGPPPTDSRPPPGEMKRGQSTSRDPTTTSTPSSPASMRPSAQTTTTSSTRTPSSMSSRKPTRTRKARTKTG